MGSAKLRASLALTGRVGRWLWRSRLRGWLLAAAVGLILYASRAHLLPPVARFLNVADPPQAVDYVMILGGDYETRPFVAAAWVRAGLAQQVLVPHVHLSLDAQEGLIPHEQEILRRVLLACGLADQDIRLLPE